MKVNRFLTLFLTLMLCILCALTGCSKKDEAAFEATTDEATETAAITQSASQTESKTESETADTTPTETIPAETIPESGNSNTATPIRPGTVINSNSSGNHKPNTNTSGGSVADAGPSDSAKHCTITVGNKGYVKDVGDKVTYTFYLTTPDKVEDIQADLTYDSRMLKLLTTDAQSLFPIMGAGVIHNTGIKDTIKFNALNISGFDFTSRGVLITAEFEVLRNGGTGIATAIEIMSKLGGDCLIDGFIVTSDGIVIEETLS